MKVNIKLLHAGAITPTRAHEGDAGADLYYCGDEVILRPGERKLLPLGIAIEIPFGYVGLVHPRSGLAHKHGLTTLNAPGTIDAQYRGECFVNLINLGHDDAVISYGDRLAQLVVQQVELPTFNVVAELSDTARGINGHGSTGTLANVI